MEEQDRQDNNTHVCDWSDYADDVYTILQYVGIFS